MKRSEMIVAMTEYWLGLFPGERFDCDQPEELFNDVSSKMSSLLNMVEYEGMKPPSTGATDIDCQLIHGWEKEDGAQKP